MKNGLKIAVVCEWLTTYAGSERVIEQILKLYPQADVFCVLDTVENREFLQEKKTITTFIQKMPQAKTRYQFYLPLMPLAIEQLDVSSYDVVISVAHAVAKGVLTGPDQIHISYVNTPIRYAWDLQHQYMKESGMGNSVKGWIARVILHYMRLWDYRTANGVDYFIANSNYIAKRIKKVYGRNSKVIFPPVDVEKYQIFVEKGDYYFTASRLVPYKKVTLIAEAFKQMPEKKLIIIGSGPDLKRIKAMGAPNIHILGWQPQEVLCEKMQKAKAFIFASEEDFGIAPVEAQACGTPVIAYGRGGARDTVINIEEENPTGIFFEEQSIEAIVNAVHLFEQHKNKFVPKNCRLNAERFSNDIFKSEFADYIDGILLENNLIK